MSEFDLRMKYTNPQTQVGMRSLALLFPAWGVALPTTLILFIVLLLRLPSNIPLLSSLAIIFFLLLTIGACATAALLLDDDEVRVSKDGLRFPIKFLKSLKYKNQRQWSELISLKLNWKRNESYSLDERIDFIFQDGGHAQLLLCDIAPGELEQFFIAFEACAYRCERDADVPDFERALQTRRPGSLYSFTELWEKSLSDRFSGATFAPLEPNAHLQESRYQILRQLAFGGFSAIYLARPASGGFVVLKESAFPQTDEVQSKATELFKREHQLLSKLNHPNVSKVLDYFVENQRHYLVVEHIEGIDLNRLVMQSGAQKADVVMGWMRQVADALTFIHSQSPPIVHRDVTPDNLLLKPDGTLILIDFGAAKEIVGSFTGTIIGKQAFIAPEQFKGKPIPKSDVYSLGATAHFLLTGNVPEALSPSRPADQVKGVPSDLNELIGKCTSQTESDRPTSAEISEALSLKQVAEVVVR